MKIIKTILLIICTISFLNAQNSNKIYKNFTDSIFITDSATAVNLYNFFCQRKIKQIPAKTIKPDSLLNTARQYLGVPHCMGGITKKCIDCSGLVYVSFLNFGITLPRDANDIAAYGNIILIKDSLQPGDLVFFVRTYKTLKLFTHIGLYSGNGNMIHTSSSKGVQEINFVKSTYWNTRFVLGTRILSN